MLMGGMQIARFAISRTSKFAVKYEPIGSVVLVWNRNKLLANCPLYS